MQKDFAKRAVHLDFHTSPYIPNIGGNFTKENFQEMLKKGHLSSITVFAKCHHGLCYYPTEVGTMHPNLNFDLTGAMVEAAHEIGVKAPVYITAGWSELDGKAHPDWYARKADGSISVNNPALNLDADANDARPRCTWVNMCLNDGPYCEHIYEITEEVCKRYKDLDGLFYDICFIGSPCYCETCKKGMREMGLNPDNHEDAMEYYKIKHIAFTDKCKAILDKYHKGATIFFNSGGASVRMPEYHGCSSHFEMENLPTCASWAGYNNFQIGAKFFSNTGKNTIGMTGKFHLDWGEFGGFKTKEAILYEMATMASYGVGVSVGDQLLPDGTMDEQTYENIGYGYEYLEKLEPYCYGGKLVTNLGLYLSDDSVDTFGVSDILLENQLDYDLVKNDNFADFEAVIFPSGVVLGAESLQKLNAYIQNGGKVMFVGESLVEDGKFQIDCGLTFKSASVYDCDYIMPTYATQNVPKTPMLSYLPAVITENVDAEILAEIMPPRFNRTYEKFCGHGRTPYDKNAATYPAIAKKGNVVYVANKLSTAYREKGAIFLKRYFMEALNALGYTPKLKVDLYSQGRVTATKQEQFNRYCINLLYASPHHRGDSRPIDEIVPLYEICVEFNVPETVKAVKTFNGETLKFEQQDKVVKFTLPKLWCHELIIVEY